MIDPNLTLKFLYCIDNDSYVFEGYWKGQWFQAIFIWTDFVYGWQSMTNRLRFSKDDEGVFNCENPEFDDIQDALMDVNVSIDYKVEIE